LVFFTERARRIVDAITPSKESDASPRAAVAGARVAYAALLSLYEKLDKDDVAAGPGGSVDKFNAHCAKYLVSELDGAGVTAVAIADSTNAWNAWKARRDYEAAQPRAMDGSGDGSLDPEPERISTGVKARARLAAFRAYVALVTRTQTKAKFYEAVFEPRGGVAEMTKRWNSLLEPSFKPKLEVEARLVSDRAARRTKASGRNPAAAPVEPTLPFTLSATLAAGDATLGAPPVNPSSVPDDDRRVRRTFMKAKTMKTMKTTKDPWMSSRRTRSRRRCSPRSSTSLAASSPTSRQTREDANRPRSWSNR
jgi:hypothetical protein